MIKPHGADALNPLLVTDSEQRDRLLAEAATLPSLLLNSAAAANAVMLGGEWLPGDPHQIDYEKLPRVTAKHAVISDVRDHGGTHHPRPLWFEGRLADWNIIMKSVWSRPRRRRR